MILQVSRMEPSPIVMPLLVAAEDPKYSWHALLLWQLFSYHFFFSGFGKRRSVRSSMLVCLSCLKRMMSSSLSLVSVIDLQAIYDSIECNRGKSSGVQNLCRVNGSSIYDQLIGGL